MKIVFLDVDGVLNYDGCKERFGGFLGVEDALVDRLAKIVHAANAQIVLVSSWKTLWDEEQPRGEMHPMAKYLVEKLKKAGLHIADRTTDAGSDRGNGINKWIRHVSAKEIENFVVLDDEVFYDYEREGILPHLVKTSFYAGGLSDQNVEEAIKILNEKK